MKQNKWISTKDELPKKGDSIILTYPCIRGRQYWVVEHVDYNLHNGKLIYGYIECDYWQHIKLIKE